MSKLIQEHGLFKHTHVFSRSDGGEPYFYYKNGGGIIDGINRQHIDLYCTCDTCNKEVRVARIHVDQNGVLYGIKEKEK